MKVIANAGPLNSKWRHKYDFKGRSDENDKINHNQRYTWKCIATTLTLRIARVKYLSLIFIHCI